jgi:hypothetical protein
LFASTSACIQRRSRLVTTASVLSFGVNNVPWSILRMHALVVETDVYIVIPQWARWIGASVLVCGYFSMHAVEVWNGIGSVGPFVQGRKCVLFHFADECTAG